MPPSTNNPGCLVLVVGPSGAGKDALIQGARARLAGNPQFVFPRRLVTRQADAYEPHRAITEAEFEQQNAGGAFFLSWGAHGNRYALPGDIAASLAGNHIVVANVSRTVIEDACKLCSTVRVVNVIAGPGILRERLLARGREGTGDVENRIARSAAVALPDCAPVDALQNEGPLAVSIARFVELLRGYAKSGQREMSRNRAPAAG